MKNKRFLRQLPPNMITSLNLLAGALSIVVSFEDNLLMAAYFIFIAAILDFFDGFVARAVNGFSEFGKMLDSLADTISFGLAPAVLLYHVMADALDTVGIVTTFSTGQVMKTILLILPFLIAIFSALRLAKFNIDKRQTDSFIGLPTPASAIFFASLIVFMKGNENPEIHGFLTNPYILTLFVLVFSFLMVAGIRMFSFKFKTFAIKHNVIRYLFLLLSLLLLILLQVPGLMLIIIFYVFLSVLAQLARIRKEIQKMKGRKI
jgi:CDP-diacylglycerol--serine O-phosphatidyltransferase